MLIYSCNIAFPGVKGLILAEGSRNTVLVDYGWREGAWLNRVWIVIHSAPLPAYPTYSEFRLSRICKYQFDQYRYTFIPEYMDRKVKSDPEIIIAITKLDLFGWGFPWIGDTVPPMIPAMKVDFGSQIVNQGDHNTPMETAYLEVEGFVSLSRLQMLFVSAKWLGENQHLLPTIALYTPNHLLARIRLWYALKNGQYEYTGQYV